MCSTITECSSFRSKVKCDNFIIIILIIIIIIMCRGLRSSNFGWTIFLHSICSMVWKFQSCSCYPNSDICTKWVQMSGTSFFLLARKVLLMGNLMKYSNSVIDLLCILQRFILNSIFTHHSPPSDIRWKMRANTNTRTTHLETIVLLGIMK